MVRSLLGFVGLAGTVVLAVPIAILGVEFLLSGRPLGAAFLGVAALMLLIERYVTSPKELPVELAGSVLGADEEDE